MCEHEMTPEHVGNTVMQLHVIHKPVTGRKYIGRWTTTFPVFFQLLDNVVNVIACTCHMKNTTQRSVELDERGIWQRDVVIRFIPEDEAVGTRLESCWPI